MLIPIGQEDSIVRRQPWVSYGLLAANVLFFLVTAAADRALAQARAHPASAVGLDKGR